MAAKKEVEKTRRALEIEKQQSFLRMQSPQYVEQLRAIGYNIPTEQVAQAQPQQKIGASCGIQLNVNNRFCPKCGARN